MLYQIAQAKLLAKYPHRKYTMLCHCLVLPLQRTKLHSREKEVIG